MKWRSGARKREERASRDVCALLHLPPPAKLARIAWVRHRRVQQKRLWSVRARRRPWPT